MKSGQPTRGSGVDLTRRGVVTAAIGGGALLAAGRPALASVSPPEIGDPIGAFVRMRSGPRGEYAYWAYAGTMFGRLLDQPAKPLFNIVGIGIGRFTKRAEGGYTHINNEVGYYTDLKTGAPLGAWLNPLNGAACTLVPYKSRQEVTYLPDSTILLRVDPAHRFESYGVVPPPKVQGRSLWMSEDLFAKSISTTGPAAGPRATVSTSLASFRIDVADLKAPVDEMIPAQFYYETLNTWRPNMKMGGVPGILSTRMTADKAADASQLTPEVARWINRDYPDFLKTGL